MLDSFAAGSDFNQARLRSPGRTQGFGVMLATHPRTLRVLSASENVEAELGLKHADILGQALPDLLGPPSSSAELRQIAPR